MDKERIVGASDYWDEIKAIFRSMGLTISKKNESFEYVSHGVLVIVEREGLFLQMGTSYEYRCVLHGQYTGAKLYHYLSLISEEERKLLLLHPFIQWRKIYAKKNMPGYLYRRLLFLQKFLPFLYVYIPIAADRNSYCITIPKGRAIRAETSTQAALRELYEETGIRLSEKDLSTPRIERHTGTDGNIYTTCIYAAYLSQRPVISLAREFKGYFWINADQEMLLSRQSRMLFTFLSAINEPSNHGQRVQSTREHRIDKPTESSEEQSSDTTASTDTPAQSTA